MNTHFLNAVHQFRDVYWLVIVVVGAALQGLLAQVTRAES